jgi:hypothetical protein
MTRRKYSGFAALAAGLLSTVFGCSKEPVAPRAAGAAPTNQASAAARQLNWQQFTARVEAGTLADPYGQYVSKATQVAGNGGPRVQRPKRDEAAATLLSANAPDAATGPEGQILLPEDPIDGGGGGGYYPPPFTFVSSEGQSTAPWANATEYITDLKLVSDAGYSYQFGGYNRLNLDLNKGAGGRYIYLTFHRGSSGVEFSNSNAPLTRLSVLTRSFSGNYSVSDHEPIWMGQWLTDHVQVAPLDLNENAGGDYIYSFQSRNTSFGGPIREVGIIASSNSNVQPPAGWERVGVDLNKGAGGDYIYFCVKR